MVLEETPSILLALSAVMVLSASISINNFTVLKLLPFKSFSEVFGKSEVNAFIYFSASAFKIFNINSLSTVSLLSAS